MTNDVINHPSHYADGNIEVIDFIESRNFPYHLGNVVKYVSRAGKKNPDKELEDLFKARWYLNRFAEKRIENTTNSLGKISPVDFANDKKLSAELTNMLSALCHKDLDEAANYLNKHISNVIDNITRVHPKLDESTQKYVDDFINNRK